MTGKIGLETCLVQEGPGSQTQVLLKTYSLSPETDSDSFSLPPRSEILVALRDEECMTTAIPLVNYALSSQNAHLEDLIATAKLIHPAALYEYLRRNLQIQIKSYESLGTWGDCAIGHKLLATLLLAPEKYKKIASLGMDWHGDGLIKKFWLAVRNNEPTPLGVIDNYLAKRRVLKTKSLRFEDGERESKAQLIKDAILNIVDRPDILAMLPFYVYSDGNVGSHYFAILGRAFNPDDIILAGNIFPFFKRSSVETLLNDRRCWGTGLSGDNYPPFIFTANIDTCCDTICRSVGLPMALQAPIAYGGQRKDFGRFGITVPVLVEHSAYYEDLLNREL